MLRIGLIQLDAQNDLQANLDAAEQAVRSAAAGGAQLVALPEQMHLRVGRGLGRRYLETAQTIPGPITERFAQLASELNIHLLMGSIAERSDDPDRVYNTCVFIGPAGDLLATYRKVHLFDITVSNEINEQESKRFAPGSQIVVADDPTNLPAMGLSICYDLRFGELYRALAIAGAKLAFVPSNFTKTTGQAHWLTLLRGRAIDNGMFIIAPNQCQAFEGGFEAYGHSAVIGPWGEVLLEMDDQPGVGLVDIDLDEVDRVREKLPCLKHRRPEVYGQGL